MFQCLERFANDGAALRGNPPDSKRAADMPTHAFAECQHMPPIRQGLKRGSVAGPSPVRIALERDLTLGVCRCLAQERELLCRHRSAPNEGALPGSTLPEKRSRPAGRPKSREETPKEGSNTIPCSRDCRLNLCCGAQNIGGQVAAGLGA